MFSILKKWVGVQGGKLTADQMAPVLENLKNHLIGKNVASEVATELCSSISKQLVDTELGAFERVSSRVRLTMEDTCRRLLNCGRRVDVLRDVLAAKQLGRPYVMAFCGVNGVGKSTNLAKVALPARAAITIRPSRRSPSGSWSRATAS